MDYSGFSIKADNKWVYKIVEDSAVLENILTDIKQEIPELIKVKGLKAVKHSLVVYICNPAPFKAYSYQTAKLIKILKKHLILDNRELTEFEKIANKLRGKVRNSVKKINISEDFEELLGCSCDELIEYLENQFEPEMSWDNYGAKGWHIDHIKPLCSFKLSDPDEVKKATHYTNLRPLWAKDNLAKSKFDRKLSIRKKVKK